MKILSLFQRYIHSFQIRVFLALSLIIFIFIPGTGYIGFLQAYKVVENQIQQYTISTAAQITMRISSFLDQHKYNVRLIKSLLEDNLVDAANQNELLHYFSLFQKDHPEFVNIYYGDTGGGFFMVPPQIPEVHSIFDPRVRPWYQGAVETGDLHWTDVYIFASTQKPGITVSIPIFAEDGELQGVCGIDIDLSAFSRFLEGIEIGKEGFAYIFENKQGHVIAHPGLVQLPWNEQHIGLLRYCRERLQSNSSDFGLITFKGKDYFTAYADYPGKDWTVGVTLPFSEYYETIRFIKKSTSSLIIIGILLSSILSYLLARTVIRPLHTLQQGIDRISSGDLEYKVEITDPDIASDLAASFNGMASSLRKSLAELKQTYVELAEKEKLAAVGEMTAGIAHEIKNPLGVIQGSAQVVLDRRRPWEMRERAARFIIDEVERLDNTLKAFLSFARPAPPVLVETDVIRLLEETLSATEERYREEGYVFIREYDEGILPIEADRYQIRQVFWNICLNSIQAMPEGGIITIRVGMVNRKEYPDGKVIERSLDNPFAIQRNWLSISIEDGGCGIPEAKIEKVMDPFVSLRDDGIGLGLSIVSQIVKLHRGQVKVTSLEGEGTVFTILFPGVMV
ncbi:cache domain-containing protein [Desulfopila inferna]|uniref:cache domain-containing protein n=1 Tax=Desulfopila inferna TaxID=468528 RepID=UPI001964C372|nr:cache domain-containing protein [Desulfopila inferna]MBM9606629.1 HAMP domain-containing protein [Desulfopila inferna]